MSANTDASTQFTQNLTHSFVRSMLKLLIAKLNFFTFGYLYTNLKDTAGQFAMVESESEVHIHYTKYTIDVTFKT